MSQSAVAVVDVVDVPLSESLQSEATRTTASATTASNSLETETTAVPDEPLVEDIETGGGKGGTTTATTTTRRYFTKRRVACWTCTSLGVLVVAIVVAGLVLYFGYWVGVPTVTILDMERPSNNNNNNAVIDLGDNGKRVPSVSLTVMVNVRIDNPNKLDLPFSKVDIQGFHPTMLSGAPIATATLTDVVLGKQAPTFLTLPLFLRYSFVGGSDNNDTNGLPRELMESCTIAAGATRPAKQLQLTMVVEATFRVVGPITVKIPRIESTQSFDCPFATKQTINLPGGVDVNTALDWTAISKGKLALLE